jgi:hypothetical protein
MPAPGAAAESPEPTARQPATGDAARTAVAAEARRLDEIAYGKTNHGAPGNFHSHHLHRISNTLLRVVRDDAHPATRPAGGE